MLRAGNGVAIQFEKLKNTEETGATEGATSRKCEGQLSSVKANSCSSYKGVNRTAEMAQEDTDPFWDNLPSVILQEIFSYLPHDSRIRASQVCKNWRCALFHPSFWKKITFALKDDDSISWVGFLIESFGLSVHEATVSCDTPYHFGNEILTLLKKLSSNRQLRKLFLEFNNAFEHPTSQIKEDDDSQTNIRQLMQLIVKIIETSNHLEALSLGYVEELTANASIILEPLRLHHAKHLTHLSLASVKCDPDFYDFLELHSFAFNSFIRLSVLTIDYDFVNDALLEALDNGTMQRLVIHVHGINNNYPGTTNGAWQTFTDKNPHCELRLNLMHSYVGIKVLDTKILCPSMPLTHLKVLFCEDVNIRAMDQLSRWYPLTLKSLIWIDYIGFTENMPATFDPDEPFSPDPLVLIAWRCTKLEELVFIGHTYQQENMLAIARLRESTLKLLVFAKSNIIFDHESWHKTESIEHEIQEIMGRPWGTLCDRDLPAAVVSPSNGDSREVIMQWVLRDQK